MKQTLKIGSKVFINHTIEPGEEGFVNAIGRVVDINNPQKEVTHYVGVEKYQAMSEEITAILIQLISSYDIAQLEWIHEEYNEWYYDNFDMDKIEGCFGCNAYTLTLIDDKNIDTLIKFLE